jgi:hypothetical protein
MADSNGTLWRQGIESDSRGANHIFKTKLRMAPKGEIGYQSPANKQNSNQNDEPEGNMYAEFGKYYYGNGQNYGIVQQRDGREK